MSTRTPLPNRFKELREAQGLSIEGLSQTLHVNPGNIYDWEAGAKDPSIRRLIQMAKFFNCSLEYLLCLTEEKTLSVESKKAITDICINPEDLQKSEQSEECDEAEEQYDFNGIAFFLKLIIPVLCFILGFLVNEFFL